MSLLDDFQELLTDIEVYELESSTSSWGTSEMEYPTLATKTVKGFIQPRGGSAVFKNQSRDVETSNILYIYATDSVNDTDKITCDGETFFVTDNPPNGIGGINDHKEIGLKRGK